MLVRILFGLGAWCLISLAVGIVLGPMLGRRSRELGRPEDRDENPQEKSPEG